MNRKTILLIGMYLGAIVLANVLFARWGMAVEPWISMMLIGFDLTSRDYLHQAWGGRGLAWKMGLLILSGSALSAALGIATGDLTAGVIEGGVIRVAFASAAAFAAAGTVDALSYAILRQRWLRVNGSNAVSALIDSAVFPFVAFGVIDWSLAAYFAAIKFIGGAIWWLALGGWRDVLRLLGVQSSYRSA